MSLLSHYEYILELSRKMERLACDLNLDALSQTEGERRRLLASLAQAELRRLPFADQKAIADIIQQIQSCDTTVREFVLPWQEDVGAMLARLSPKP